MVSIPPSGYSFVWVSSDGQLWRKKSDGYTYMYSGYVFYDSTKQAGIEPPSNAKTMPDEYAANPYQINAQIFQDASSLYGLADLRAWYPVDYIAKNLCSVVSLSPIVQAYDMDENRYISKEEVNTAAGDYIDGLIPKASYQLVLDAWLQHCLLPSVFVVSNVTAADIGGGWISVNVTTSGAGTCRITIDGVEKERFTQTASQTGYGTQFYVGVASHTYTICAEAV